MTGRRAGAVPLALIVGLMLTACTGVTGREAPTPLASAEASPTTFEDATHRPVASPSIAPEVAATPTLDPDEPVYEDDPSAQPAGSFRHDARITRTVTDAGGRPLAHARILTEPPPIREIGPIETGSHGRFDLARYGLRPGRYTVTARLDGYQDASIEVDATSDPVHVDLVLESDDG